MMLYAALRSRSWVVPHVGHTQTRSDRLRRGFRSSGQPPVADHPFDHQIFQYDDLVFVNEPARHLMQEVLPHVVDVQMELGDALLGFLVVG